MPAGPHPAPPSWLVVLTIVLAVVPFAVLGDLVGASERAIRTLQVGVLVVTLIGVLIWRALHRTYGSVAARAGTFGVAFVAFAAMILVSRMAAFPRDVFALPFLFPVWIAVVLLVGSRVTDRLARRRDT